MRITLPWPDRTLHPNARVHWASDEDAALSAALEAGHSVDDIALASGRSKGAVKNRAWRLGLLKSKDWSSEEISKLTQLYMRVPLDTKDIARQLGRTVDAVEIKAGRIGLSNASRPKKLPEDIVSRRKHATKNDANRAIGEAARARIAQKGHPRGALGMKHTAATKKIIAEKSRAVWSSKTPMERDAHIFSALQAKRAAGVRIANPRGSWKAAWRLVGSQRVFFRSRWEANYARYLEWLRTIGQIAGWEHEAKTFWFDGIKRGCVSYLPDFKVTNLDGSIEWHEVKGWMDARSKTTLARMARYHPTEKLVVIREKQYMEIKRKVSALINGWEE